MRFWAFLSLGLQTVPVACGGSIAATGTAGDAGDEQPVSAVGYAYCPWGHGSDPNPPDPCFHQGPCAPPVVIPYSKSCSAVSDCAIGLHLDHCCGQKVALGINSAELSRFSVDGGICGNEVPMCGCAPRDDGTIAEDGRVSGDPQGIADILVKCERGACLTYVEPDGP
jgi:hypothetical protein